MKGKRRWTALLMGAGGLFLVAALLLTVYNLLTEWRAGEQAQEILEQLEEQLRYSTFRNAISGRRMESGRA